MLGMHAETNYAALFIADCFFILIDNFFVHPGNKILTEAQEFQISASYPRQPFGIEKAQDLLLSSAELHQGEYIDDT